MKDERVSQEAPTIDLGIAGRRVPVHSHIAYLCKTKSDFEEAVGFVEAGLRGPDHCVVVGEEEGTAVVVAVLENRGFDVESHLTELAERFDSVLLCLHQLPATTGLILRHGVLGTHPTVLERAEVLANPLFLPLEEIPERLPGIASDVSKQQEQQKEARRATEALQAIFDNIPVMISFRNSAGGDPGRAPDLARTLERVSYAVRHGGRPPADIGRSPAPISSDRSVTFYGLAPGLMSRF